MSTENTESMGTKPVAEHAWLQNLVGVWETTSEMFMGPDQPPMVSHGREVVRSLDGLWATGEGTANMPDGTAMTYISALGYDVSFKEYRGCWFASMSSHLWKQTGTLSADGKTMTLLCEGPHMEKDGETAMYRDVLLLVDADTRKMMSAGQNEDGSWSEFMTVTYRRVSQ